MTTTVSQGNANLNHMAFSMNGHTEGMHVRGGPSRPLSLGGLGESI